MYNNTCHSGGNVVSSIWSSGLKKQQKRLRVPKRGPGVAELERILREQKGIDITDNGNSEGIDGNQYNSVNSPLNIWPSSGTIQKRNNQYSLPTIVGMKRSHSSTLENSLKPPSNFHVLPSFSHYNRSHQSSINDSHGVSSFDSTKECYRDAKWGRTLELSDTRYNSDIAVPGHANFPPFDTPEVPSPPMHLFPGVLSKGDLFPCQVTEDNMDSYQHSESSGPDPRPFYNFLEVEDGGHETGRVGIDLNLKL
ncbi:hypothetical protein E2542_SST21647 [Spatholobus suberectus]|nr:hypothetical protein E2542_SST21647 [Spatholobus suberectus]